MSDTTRETLPARIEAWILNHPHGTFAAAVLLFLLWHGVAALPHRDAQRMVLEVTTAWSAHTSVSHHMESPTYYLLANLLGATTVPLYLLYCCVFILAAVLWQYHSVRKTLDNRTATIVILLFLGHPVFYMLTNFVGLSDPLLVLCTVIILHARTTAVIVLASTIGTMVHPSMAFIAPSVLTLRLLGGADVVRRRHILLALLGIACGLTASQIYLNVMHIGYLSRWEFIQRLSPLTFVANVTRNPSLVAYSLFFSLWIPVVLALHWYGRRNARYTTAYLIILLAGFGATLLTIDTTRVAALLTWAPTLHMLSRTCTLAASGTDARDHTHARILALTALAGLAMPRFFFWNGVLHAPGHQLLFDLLKPLFT